MCKPRGALRPIAENTGGVLLVVLAMALSFGATYVRDDKHLVPGISTAEDVPGTCHNDQDYFEVELASATLTPAVPCTSPHTSEVVWTVKLTGVVAEQHHRPTPEMLAPAFRELCQQPQRLAAYIGADQRGFLYNLNLEIRYPSAPEWRAGVRTARCIAGPWYVSKKARATLDFPLKGSWKRQESAAIRLCANGEKDYLPCDQPHTQEVLQPVNPFPATQIAFPPPALSRTLGQAPCTEQALALLGLPAMPADLRVVVAPAELVDWPQFRAVGCRIESARRTGSLAGA